MSNTAQHFPTTIARGSRVPTLAIAGLQKAYGTTMALAGVDLEVPAGTILGLLGPNGAGKTSLVSIVAGLRRPDAGTVHVGGIDVVRDPQRARGLVGLAPQDTGVYMPLRVRDNLRFFAGLAGMRRAEQRARIDEIADALGLVALLDRRAADLSGGERRRLHTAIALLHRPPLVLLDEPTTGADVRTRTQILQLVRRLAGEGSAIVYSTHYLHEIEELGADVAFIDRGLIVTRGTVAALTARYGVSALELTFHHEVPECARVDCAIVDGSSVRIPAADPAAAAADLLPRLGSHATELRSIEIVRPSLESVFLTVTGRRFGAPALEPPTLEPVG
jgi:ABC-2 type transport system ATP-binding protein